MGGWKDLPGTAQPAGPGTKYPELNLLTSRLQAEGDLPGGTAGDEMNGPVCRQQHRDQSDRIDRPAGSGDGNDDILRSHEFNIP